MNEFQQIQAAYAERDRRRAMPRCATRIRIGCAAAIIYGSDMLIPLNPEQSILSRRYYDGDGPEGSAA